MTSLSVLVRRTAVVAGIAFGLAACGDDGPTQTPEALFNAFEKSVLCDVGPTDEVVGLYMPQTAASARYVETLRRGWSRESAAVRTSECHGWDDATRISETRAVEVSPGKWRLDTATAPLSAGNFKPIRGVHIARMDGGDLKVVAGNP